MEWQEIHQSKAVAGNSANANDEFEFEITFYLPLPKLMLMNVLEVQPGQLAVILLGNGTCLKDVVAQLTGIVRCIQHQKGNHSDFPSDRCPQQP